MLVDDAKRTAKFLLLQSRLSNFRLGHMRPTVDNESTGVCVFTKNIPHEGTADEGVKGSWCIDKTMPSFSKCLKMFIRVKNLHNGSRQDDKNTCYVNMHTLLQLLLVNSGKFS